MTRGRRHLILAGFGVGTCFTAWFAGDSSVAWDRISIVTAYLCLALLCIGLSVGPRRALHTGRSTLNSYLRRDIGIWTALIGLTHLVVATELSMNPSYVDTVVNLADSPIGAALFSWGSVLGFLVGLNFLLLLGLSSDRALRVLGVTWWKRLQRSSYLGFIMTIAHGFAFQALERRTWLLVTLLLLATILVAGIQLRGMWAVAKGSRP